MMVWEAHKGYIRGVLIKIGSVLLEAGPKQIVDLLEMIRALEANHRKSLADKALTDLMVLRNQLRSHALDRAKATIAKCRCTFYEQSNKC